LKTMERSNWLGPVLQLGPVQSYLKKKIEARPAGPSDEQRAKAASYIYGEVKDVSGRTVAARLRTPEGYTLTGITSLMIVQRVLNGEAKAGYQTPAGLFGADFILEVEGTEREDIRV
ncbi:MAG: hypothetical protein WA952_13285, partial [Lewinella sp.]